jgi:hypothetical protein
MLTQERAKEAIAKWEEDKGRAIVALTYYLTDEELEWVTAQWLEAPEDTHKRDIVRLVAEGRWP